MKRLLIAFIWLIGLAMVPAAQTSPACATCAKLERDKLELPINDRLRLVYRDSDAKRDAATPANGE